MKCIFYAKRSGIIASQLIGLLKASAAENKPELYHTIRTLSQRTLADGRLNGRMLCPKTSWKRWAVGPHYSLTMLDGQERSTPFTTDKNGVIL